MNRDEILAAVAQVDALHDRLTGNAAESFYSTPEDRERYAQHVTVFEAGQHFRERAAFGGNRVGKSTRLAEETRSSRTKASTAASEGEGVTTATIE